MRISTARARQLGLAGGDSKSPRAAKRPEPAKKTALPPRRQAVEFVVDGRPVAKGRHRTSMGGYHTYTPDDTTRYAELVRAEARLAMRGTGPMTGPVRAILVVEVVPPRSWSGRKRADALAGAIAPTVKPDTENYQKNVLDALNGVTYRDDAQVVSTVADKRYGTRARTHIRIEPVDARPAYDIA